MRSASINAVGILNASVQLTMRVATPWVGVLWFTTLPLRLLQLYFFTQLAILMEPQYYAYYLWKLAMIVFAAFLFSLYGRAVYVRACRFAENSTRDSRLEALKVPLSDFIPYVYTSLINEVCFFLTSFTMFMWPIFIIYSGLAAATSYNIGGPKLLKAPLTALKAAAPWRSLLAMSFVFLIGLIIALVNLHILVLVALALGGQILGPALPRWEYIFEPSLGGMFPKQPLTYLLLFMGASMLIEPFWLAANVDLVQKSRARKSGEDLQLWFHDIKNEAAR